MELIDYSSFLSYTANDMKSHDVNKEFNFSVIHTRRLVNLNIGLQILSRDNLINV